jgi:hypothetical protein
MRLVALALICAVALAVSSAQPRNPRVPEDLEIVEEVFRYQLQHYSQEKRWNVFYLAFGLTDPGPAPDETLEAFSKHIPPVKKFIKNEYDVTRIVQEKGIVLGVGKIKKNDNATVEVEGYTFVVPGEAQGFLFHLIRENGKWLVKSRKATWTA